MFLAEFRPVRPAGYGLLTERTERGERVESARIELNTAPGGPGAAWKITLHLEIGVVQVPDTYPHASVAEAVARDQAETLGFRVTGATYGSSTIELQLQRAGSGQRARKSPKRS
jgi:hypothetical protein